MSVYQQHKEHRRELREAVDDYSDALRKKQVLFQRTQPSSVPFDRDGGKTTPGSGTDTIDAYLIECEESGVDARLSAAKELIDYLTEQLQYDELLLYHSNEVIDHVYYMAYIERATVPDIASRLHYSQSYVYRLIKEIG